MWRDKHKTVKMLKYQTCIALHFDMDFNASGINEVSKKGDWKRYCLLKKMQHIDKDFFRFSVAFF